MGLAAFFLLFTLSKSSQLYVVYRSCSQVEGHMFLDNHDGESNINGMLPCTFS